MTLCPSTSRSPRIAARCPKRLPRLSRWSMLAGVWVDDMTQPRPRLALTRATTRLPRAASLSANPVAADPVAADPVAADRSAPVLTAAPLIRVAHTRRADVPRTADHVCRNVSARPTANDIGRDRDRHQSTPAGAAGSKKQTGNVRPPPRVACARERRHGIED